ncbi:MAG: DMT family transporter [Granulosicoccus sp.]
MSGSPVSLPVKENHVVGILWMLLTMSLFVSMDTVVKYLVQSFSPFQIVWARFFFHVFWLSLLLRKELFAALLSNNLKLQLARSACLVLTTCLFFNGLLTTELSTATSIMFLSPIFVTLLAIPLLGERVGIRRMNGVLLGFVGALIIVNPQSQPSVDVLLSADETSSGLSWLPETGHLLLIAAAASNALYQIMTRKLRAADNPMTTLLYSAVVGVVAMSLWAPVVWKTPDLTDWPLMMLVGFLGLISHFCLIRALHHAPASVVVPFSYSALLWAIVLSFMVFGDLPDGQTLFGAALIIASGLYIFYRETQGKQKDTQHQ